MRQTGATYPWLVRSTAMVNHFYFYCVDRDFGPFFLKFCTYFPYNAKLCLNGHEYAKQQLAHKRDRLRGARQWHPDVATIPSGCRPSAMGSARRRSTPCCASGCGCCRIHITAKDRKAGYRYQISILQAEFSLTQVLDRPVTGRVFFEEVIRENLDIGRPSQVQLIFDRRVSTRARPAGSARA